MAGRSLTLPLATLPVAMSRPGPRIELEALAAEGGALGGVLRSIPPGDWARPTRCPLFDVRMIVVHLLRQADGVADVCDQPFVDLEPQKDRLTWWDYDIEEDQADTVRWVTEAAKNEPPGPLHDRYAEALSRAVAGCERSLASGDPVVKTGAGMIRLSDYVATRVLEVTIHAMDIRDALGLAPAPTREGMAVTREILSGRLGTDPAMDDVHFALAATGRAMLTEAERVALGPLAAEFPMLA